MVVEPDAIGMNCWRSILGLACTACMCIISRVPFHGNYPLCIFICLGVRTARQNKGFGSKRSAAGLTLTSHFHQLLSLPYSFPPLHSSESSVQKSAPLGLSLDYNNLMPSDARAAGKIVFVGNIPYGDYPLPHSPLHTTAT